jgi:2'-5' RNA ligase
MMGDPAAAEADWVRLFYAVMPTGAAVAASSAAGRALPVTRGARLVPAVNHHLTVAFVGSVPASRLGDLRAIGRRQPVAGFPLRFDAYEYWPKPEVIVAAARVIPSELTRLWEQLHRDLAANGFAIDPKRLRPHVTLARKVTQAPVLQALSPFDWPVDQFSLVRSDTRGVESVYTVVDTWPLLYDAEKHWKTL